MPSAPFPERIQVVVADNNFCSIVVRADEVVLDREIYRFVVPDALTP